MMSWLHTAETGDLDVHTEENVGFFYVKVKLCFKPMQFCTNIFELLVHIDNSPAQVS